MGTKVQCNSYFQGYYSMRDLNEEFNSGSWPLYFDDKTLNNELYYNTSLPRANCKDGYFGYDREELKQTMIKQETIFRNQVYELHRLYKIQRDLMDELKRKELHKHLIPMETSQSSPFSSQMPSEEARQMWHGSQLPLLNTTSSRPSVSCTDNVQSPLSSIKGNSIHATQNGGSLTDREFLESKPKKFHRRMFDLQLPANEYIDSEEGEQFEEEKFSEVSVMASYPPRSSCVVALDREVKLSLSSVGNPKYQGDASRSDSCLRSTSNLADLNQPVLVEEATASIPVDFLGAVISHKEIQGWDLPAKPNSDFLGLPKEVFNNNQRGRGSETFPNSLHLENMGNEREWLSYKSGQSRTNLNSFIQGFCPEKFPTPSRPIQVELKRGHDLPAFLLSDQNKREPWRERGLDGLETSGRSYGLSNYNSPGSVGTSCIQSPYLGVPKPDGANSVSPLVSSWRKPLNQDPVAVQTHPCFKAPTALTKSSKLPNQLSGLIGDKWNLNSNSMLDQSFGNEISYRNGFCLESQSESKSFEVRFPSVGFDYLNCSVNHNSATEPLENHGPTKHFKGSVGMDVKSAKDVNLNLVLPNGFRDVHQQELLIIDGKENHEDPPGGLPWLRTKAGCNIGPTKERGVSTKMGSSSLQAYSHQFANKVEKEKGSSSSFVHDSLSASLACDTEPTKIEVGDRLNLINKKILGFPILGEPHISKDPSSSVNFSSKSHGYPSEVEDAENSGKVGLLHTDLSHNPILPNPGNICTKNLVIEKGLDNDHGGFRCHINLNSCANEEEAPLKPSVARATVKITVEIDLEAPVVPEIEEGISTGEKSLGNQPETTVQSPKQKVGDQHEEPMRIAAEAIVAISLSGVHNRLEKSTYRPSEASLSDSLHWFAEVVSSTMGGLENEVGVVLKGKASGDHEESSSDSDYFESMTLKLIETKVEDYWCKPRALENLEEETGFTSLPSLPRKGRARRGRQRRDFQRDILPGLASLSRHEVTEDLQTIGGLMRANGHPWQTGLTRRNAARNGLARGRRWSQGPVASVAVSKVCSPLRQQLDNSELGVDERSLIGWGKTTRRPPRQRYLATNPASIPLTQV